MRLLDDFVDYYWLKEKLWKIEVKAWTSLSLLLVLSRVSDCFWPSSQNNYYIIFLDLDVLVKQFHNEEELILRHDLFILKIDTRSQQLLDYW